MILEKTGESCNNRHMVNKQTNTKKKMTELWHVIFCQRCQEYSVMRKIKLLSGYDKEQANK